MAVLTAIDEGDARTLLLAYGRGALRALEGVAGGSVNSNFALETEQGKLFLRLYEEVHEAETLEEVMERGLVFAHTAILEHEVLQRILQTEPEILLPRLTVEANETHKLVAAFLVPYLVRYGMAEGTDLTTAADFLARMVLSYIGSPGRWDLNDPAQVARLVRAELLAGIR